jgi:hypothetical protein
MTTLKFKSKEFARMLNWMKTHERKIPYVNETTEDYGLWLVKDHGIYVMSASKERDLTKNDSTHVIYAQGYSPKVGDDLWHKTYAVSRDDFLEFIPLDERQIVRLENGGDLTIRLSETQLEIIA